MEGAHEGKSTNSNSNRSSVTAIIMQGLEYARNVKLLVVANFVAMVSCCLLLYLSSYNSFGQLLSFSSSFYSLNATPAGPPGDEPVSLISHLFLINCIIFVI